MNTLIAVVVLLAIVVFDLTPKWGKMPVPEKVVYCAILLAGSIVLILYTFDVPLPSPTTPIIKLIETLVPALKQ